MKHSLIIFLMASILFSCSKAPKQESDEWIILFDGTSVDGWRAFNGDSLPPGWIAKDGELTFDTELGLEQNYKGGKDIIYGTEEFENFNCTWNGNFRKAGNSGVFYHLKEGFDSPTGICPEYQLIDDINYARIHDLTEYNTSLGYENPELLHPLQNRFGLCDVRGR
ncbi:MAG: DUF1080 domain-containing protein [Cyclobacteriaceae bacterium]|nr:DUF1080 domain-containing protein [Cyclobacteriaceae bacterium]